MARSKSKRKPKKPRNAKRRARPAASKKQAKRRKAQKPTRPAASKKRARVRTVPDAPALPPPPLPPTPDPVVGAHALLMRRLADKKAQQIAESERIGALVQRARDLVPLLEAWLADAKSAGFLDFFGWESQTPGHWTMTLVSPNRQELARISYPGGGNRIVITGWNAHRTAHIQVGDHGYYVDGKPLTADLFAYVLSTFF